MASIDDAIWDMHDKSQVNKNANWKVMVESITEMTCGCSKRFDCGPCVLE